MKIIFISVFFLLSSAFSAVPKSNEILRQGKVIGGEAGNGFSLLNVSRRTQKNGGERWVLDIGNAQGEARKGRPGYYHVEKDSLRRILSIDLAQMRMSKVDQAKLNQLIKKSPYLAMPRLSSDPSDQSLNLAFHLKKDVKVKVYQVPGVKGTSRVVLDLL